MKNKYHAYRSYSMMPILTHITCLLLGVLPMLCAGQQQAHTWYFGNDGTGLHFEDDCSVTVLTDGPINGYEGCATISDASTGEYLFCTNSAHVWDRNGQLMTTSPLVTNGNTITQVTIVQRPGSDPIYYIFTTEVQAFSGQGYRFHAVDMSLNSGAGGIAFTDSVLYSSPVTEKITAIRHANGTDVWVVGHAYGSNAYLAFLVTAAGVSTTPVVSNIGKVHSDPGSSGYDAVGELKASPDGSKVVAVTLYNPDIELFSFNNATGGMSDLITLPENGAYDGIGNASGLYGASFSASGNMLYVGQWFSASANNARLLQYDLSSNDPSEIIASRSEFPTAGNPYSLKLAPDERIYVAHAAMSTHLGVIQYPDSAGQACQYADDGLYLQGGHSSWGLNNMMEQIGTCGMHTSLAGSSDDSPMVSIHPNPFAEQVSITLNTDGAAELALFELSGRRLLTTRFQKTLSLDMGMLAQGVYLYRIVLTDGRAVQGKVQKVH
jgi:hypothetical protein